MSDEHGIESPVSTAAGPGPSWPQGGCATGDADVDVVLERLGQLTDTPVPEQPALYAAISDSLLAALNQGPQG